MQGIEVITDRTHLVHVSGHPRRDELRDMISWVRPQLLIPVHGEALHLFEHAKLARAAGVPKVLICRNGDLVKLGPGDPGIIEELPSGRLYKDGSILEDSKSRAVVERQQTGLRRLRLCRGRGDRKGRTGRRSRGRSGRHTREEYGRRDHRRDRVRRRGVDGGGPAAGAAARSRRHGGSRCAGRCAPRSTSIGARSRCATFTSV